MAETILGIDIGASRIKLVQIERTMHGSELCKCAMLPNEYGGARESHPEDKGGAGSLPSPYVAIAQAIARTVQEQGLQSDRIVLGISPRNVYLRYLRFPFSSTSKIAQVVNFELEGQLPVPMDDLVTVFRKEENVPGKEQLVLAGAMAKKELLEIITAFRAVHLNLEIVDISWHGVLALLMDARDVIPDSLILVDLGWETTEVLLVRNGRVVGHRFSAQGMSAFASAESDAEGQKDMHRRPEIDEESRNQWARTTSSLIHLLTLADDDSGPRPEQMVLCGGGSLVQGMDSALERAVHIPAQSIHDLKPRFFSPLQEFSEEASLYHAAAGLALRAGKSEFGYNFRTGDFAPQTTFRDKKRRLIYMVAGCLLVVGVYIFTLVGGVQSKQDQLTTINKEIQTHAHTALPDVRSGMRPSQYLSILKVRLAEFVCQDLGENSPSGSSIEAMRAISRLVDQRFKVKLGMMALDGEKVRLSGSADGFATVENMKRRLQSSPGFANVVIKGAKSVGKDGSVQFTLELDRV